MKKLVKILFLFFIVSCGKNPTFTMLDTNRIHLIFKGTYESNGPFSDLRITKDDSVDGDAAYTDVNNINDIYFLYDIAEIRVGNRDEEDKDRHPLVSERFVVFSHYKEGELHYFFENGIEFNGQSFDYTLNVDGKDKTFTTKYKSNDIESGSYDEADVYFRKYIVYPATISGTETEALRDFKTIGVDEDGNYLPGYDASNSVVMAKTSYFGTIYGYNVHSLYGGVSSLFPMKIYGNIDIPPDGDVNVEIRIPFRNCVSLLEFDYVSSLDPENASELLFVGFSDIKSQLGTSTDSTSPLSDTLIGGVRTYIPDDVGEISGVDNVGYDYIIAIKSEDSIDNYMESSLSEYPQIPLVATRGGGVYSLKNIPPGYYRVYGVSDTNGNCYPDVYKEASVSPVEVLAGKIVSGVDIN